MVLPAISTPNPLPREREAGADDKSPKANFTRIDWSKERTPVAIIHNDAAPLALREFQLNDALLSQREFQIDEGGALAHPAKPETATMNKQPLSSFQRVLDELDAIGADTRPELAALTKAIRAFGNAQYDSLWMSMDATNGADKTAVSHVAIAADDARSAFGPNVNQQLEMFFQWAESEGFDMSVDWKGELLSSSTAGALRGWEGAQTAGIAKVNLERISFDSWLKGWTDAFKKMTAEGGTGK